MTTPGDGIYSIRTAQALLGQPQVDPSNETASIIVASPATNWGFGNPVILIAADVITNPFYIMGARVYYHNLTTEVGLHQVRFSYGAGDDMLGNWKFYLDNTTDHIIDTTEVVMGLPGGDPVPANSRISAALAYSLGLDVDASAVTFDIYYKQVTG
jgi:hypothetical protein